MSADRYTELMDAAQVQQEKTNRDARARIQALSGPESHPDFDGKHCVECDDDIPEGRLKLEKVRCVRCQSALEQSNNWRR